MATYLKITVYPDSRKESVTKSENGRLMICIREPSQDGRANKRIMAILGKIYPKTSLKIVAGERSPNKTILVGRE